MNKSEEYIKKYKEIHADNTKLFHVRGSDTQDFIYGDGLCFLQSVTPYMFEHIENKRRAITVLDYGCGKARHIHDPKYKFYRIELSDPNFFSMMQGLVQCYYCYDPAVTRYSQKPPQGWQFDFVGCADVLEHVPEEHLEETIKELSSYTKPDGLIVLTVSGNESFTHFLNPDNTQGENLHITIKPRNWWIEKIRSCVGDRAWVMGYSIGGAMGFYGEDSSYYKFNHAAGTNKKFIKWKIINE